MFSPFGLQKMYGSMRKHMLLQPSHRALLMMTNLQIKIQLIAHKKEKLSCYLVQLLFLWRMLKKGLHYVCLQIGNNDYVKKTLVSLISIESSWKASS